MPKGSTKKLLKSKKFQEYHNQSKRKLAVLVQMEKIRQELGLTQKELAEKMELDQSDVSSILSGKRNFTFNILDKFCEATGQEIYFGQSRV
jgi:DNA-binding Xre family transcriptional regulator